jgi:hypothetical protein
MPAVLGVDVEWDAGLREVQILAPASDSLLHLRANTRGSGHVPDGLSRW